MPTLRRYVFERLQHLATRFGVDMVRSTEMSHLPQARYLQRLFHEFGVTGVIDVGANEGQYHDFIRREVRFRGPILSIEPIPELAGGLRERAQTEAVAWHIEETAVGAERGNLTFNIAACSEFSSFLAPIASTAPMFSGRNAIAKSQLVSVETLSELVDRHADFLGNRVYLKLDTQGFDVEALKGLADQAHRIVALQSETSVKPIYHGMPTYTESIAFIESLGFTLSQMFPNNEGHFPVLIEFDCHFVRMTA